MSQQFGADRLTSSKRRGAERVTWSRDAEAKFISLCYIEYMNGMKLTDSVVGRICHRLNALLKTGYTVKTLQNKWISMRRSWRLLYRLRYKCGLKWDKKRGTVTGPEDQLEGIYKEDAANRSIIRRGLAHFDWCTTLFQSRVAMGQAPRPARQLGILDDDEEEDEQMSAQSESWQGISDDDEEEDGQMDPQSGRDTEGPSQSTYNFTPTFNAGDGSRGSGHSWTAAQVKEVCDAIKMIASYAEVKKTKHLSEQEEFKTCLAIVQEMNVPFAAKVRAGKQLGNASTRDLFLRDLARKHDPLMLAHLGSVPALIISAADAARELKLLDIDFPDRPQAKAAKKLLYGCKDVAFSTNGEYWRKLRSVFVLQLMSNKRVQSYGFIREEETALVVKKMRESSGRAVNLSEMFGEFAFDLISRSAFGTKYRESEDGKKISALLIEAMELSGSIRVGDFILWLSWIDGVTGFDDKLNRVARELDDFLEDVIQEHIHKQSEQVLQENKGESFVDILLQKLNESDGDVITIGRESIKAIILDVFAGGTDTITTALEWAMAELFRHPKVMQKLQSEVREIVEDREEITYNELSKMQYLKAVIKETLRIHPPVPVIQRAAAHKDVNIKGYNISRGTMVLINSWAIGMDPKTCLQL